MVVYQKKKSIAQLVPALLCLALLTVFLSCQQDEAIFIEPVAYPEVDERLWDLFESFEREANLRGFEVDLAAEGITGLIEAIDQEHVAGQCSYSPVHPGQVTVDAEFWERSSYLFKEFIVFHELGHCYLHRDHREDEDENGFCLSLMRSGLEGCRDNYNMETRTKILDELFFPGDF